MVDIIVKHNRFFHCRIIDPISNSTWFATFVYVYPDKSLQFDFWNELTSLKPSSNDPWIIMGNFNNVTCTEEKSGGSNPSSTYMHNFIHFLNSINVCSLPAEGLPFTWSNKHSDQSLIFELLDRVVANPHWLNLFPFATLENLLISGSDHGPIVLTILPVRVIKTYSLKFEAIWQSHPEFPNLVKKFWSQTLDSNPIKNFKPISNAFCFHLSHWSKEQFGNFRNKYSTLENDLAFYQLQFMNNPNSDF
ncbi:uncharacterized protein LOC112198706 [Rosa chinensis]|uniref:uncharacterized protein LOC112198706 n=1 Tax=Rosa chinensis TaxID=74649 RepID=UPI000D093633|nr:uncharacterized protein LOC112198706 [Rosa chinensis]